MTETNYIESLLRWRTDRDQQIVANPRNWLTLAGLYPLHKGRNQVSTKTGADIQLPPTASQFCGEFMVESGIVRLNILPETGFTINGVPRENRPLRLDVDGDPDILEFGQHFLMVIRRGEQFFLRLWDTQASDYLHFNGLNYFPVDPRYRVIANLQPFDPPRVSTAINAIGVESETRYLGFVKFRIDSVECSLLAEGTGDELLLNFTDATREDTTYPGGRYLEIPKPSGREITLDFNMSSNWPCAYTPYATCPLPPRENLLSVRIEAGEMRFH